MTKPREFSSEVLEPYCGECRIGFSGETYCTCGWTHEERRESGWKLDGTSPKARKRRANEKANG